MIFIPCGTQFLREFNFANGRFFVFCGNKFLRLEKTSFACWELIFAIFWKSRSNGTDNIVLSAIKMQIKQHGNVINVTLLHYNGSTITRVPLDVLSTELPMAFFSSKPVFLYIISTVE